MSGHIVHIHSINGGNYENHKPLLKEIFIVKK